MLRAAHVVILAGLCSFCAGVCSHTALAQEKAKYWVFFADKGPAAPSAGRLSKASAAYAGARAFVTPRALERRAKMAPHADPIDAADAPLYRPYIDRVAALGGALARESRWLNAASFFLDPEKLAEVAQLPGVASVRPVHVYKSSRTPDDAPDDGGFEQFATGEEPPDYGSSLAQLAMINVPPLHDLGITGFGILVGMLDTGFRWRAHEALRTRRVIGERDFIFDDDTTANQANDSFAQDQHGTLTFSLIGGYFPGKLVGAAFDAEYLLGKTEYVPSETQIEEDNWAAAIEWMESQGVDIVSSSLGYNIFDDETGYRWEDGALDGKTSVTARAAARAARLGVLVCVAMGNEGNGDGIAGTMLTPADADSILSIGAVTFTRRVTSFSSTGPTNDGRTKPDLVAPGVAGVYYAFPPGPATYGSGQQGTSLSTPLAAGAAALLLSVRPDATPVELRDALRSSADTIAVGQHPVRPNNFAGWGLVDAFDAALTFGPLFANRPAITSSSGSVKVSTAVVSKYGIRPESVLLYYRSGAGADTAFHTLVMTRDSAKFFPTSGYYSAVVPAGTANPLARFYIEASDSSGRSFRSEPRTGGGLWPLVDTTGTSGTGPDGLAQGYPNPLTVGASSDPARAGATVHYQLPIAGYARLVAYNLLGQEVAVLLDGEMPAGGGDVTFRAHDLASGVYILRLTAPEVVSFVKMALVK